MNSPGRMLGGGLPNVQYRHYSGLAILPAVHRGETTGESSFNSEYGKATNILSGICWRPKTEAGPTAPGFLRTSPLILLRSPVTGAAFWLIYRPRASYVG